MSGPLVGLRVVDCSWGMAGPKAAGMLADYGADVIRVEPPSGDPLSPELAVPYSVFNRGKRSVTLDLRDGAGLSTLFDLLETADVFLQSWQPGVARRLGLGYEEVHARAPQLIYCAISGFGPEGSAGGLPGHDALVNAVLGTLSDQGGFRNGPIFIGMPSASSGAAYLALIGVLGALLRRDADGRGRLVETSLLDGMVAYVSQSWGYSERNRERYRVGGTRFYIKTLRCADGEYIGVHTAARGAFDRLMTLLGLDDRVKPVEGSEAGTLLTEAEEAALAEIPDIFETQPRAVWLERVLGENICAIPVLHPGEVFDEPQTRHNEMVVEVTDPVLGRVEQVAPPAKFSRTPAVVTSGAPRPGEHTAEVLNEFRAPSKPEAPRDAPVDDNRPLLAGLKVLDVGHWFAGPYASRLLADLGADVIKLEPIEGDPMRSLERPFSSAQAGKRSIAMDLLDPAVDGVRRRLIEWADVIHHNLRPGAPERLGVGYEQVRAINPDVVYLHASGWGVDGPYADRQSLAPLMSGYVGADYESAGAYNPPVDPVANEDSGGGMIGAVSALMALVHRARTGEGQFIDSPHFHSALEDVAHIVRRTSDGEVLGGGALDPLQHGVGPLHRLYQTKDGWVCLVAVKDEHVEALGKVLDVDISGDARFATAALRAENSYALESVLAGAFASSATDDLVRQLRDAGVPAAVPTVENNRAFMDDPENLRIGRVGEFVHPRYGRTRQPAALVRFQGATIPELRRPPELGEHTDAILAEIGVTPDDAAALRARGLLR